MADIVERLRKEAADCIDWNGARLKRWDEIRNAVETKKGSDIPRLMYEGELEDFHDKLSEAAAEIERLTELLTVIVRNTPPSTIAHTAAAAGLCRPSSVTADKEQGNG